MWPRLACTRSLHALLNREFSFSLYGGCVSFTLRMGSAYFYLDSWRMLLKFRLPWWKSQKSLFERGSVRKFRRSGYNFDVEDTLLQPVSARKIGEITSVRKMNVYHTWDDIWRSLRLVFLHTTENLEEIWTYVGLRCAYILFPSLNSRQQDYRTVRTPRRLRRDSDWPPVLSDLVRRLSAKIISKNREGFQLTNLVSIPNPPPTPLISRFWFPGRVFFPSRGSSKEIIRAI